MNLRESALSEIASFAAMEKQRHANAFINQLSIDEHIAAFLSAEIIYLTIIGEANLLIGYFIIALEDDGSTAEFRRIVVDQKHRGVGQTAICLMEEYCRVKLQRSKIWLDVYEDNVIGIHIYEKLGYQYVRTEMNSDRKLRFYSKNLV